MIFAPFSLYELIKNEPAPYKQDYMDDGWVASSYLVPDSNLALKNYRLKFSRHKVAEEQINSLTTKLCEISSRGVQVVCFRPPTTHQMRNLEDSLSGYDEITIKKNLQCYFVVWLDFKDSDFESYDGSHLDEKSARKLSREIGDQINAGFLPLLN